MSEFRELSENFDVSLATNSNYTPLSLKFSAADDTYQECGSLAQELITLSSNKTELIDMYQPKLTAANDFLNEAFAFIGRVGGHVRQKSLSPTFDDAQEDPSRESSGPPPVSEPPPSSKPSSLTHSVRAGLGNAGSVLGSTSHGSAASSGSLNSLQRARIREKEAELKAKARKAQAESERRAEAARAEAERVRIEAERVRIEAERARVEAKRARAEAE